jgi:hypothetical protein
MALTQVNDLWVTLPLQLRLSFANALKLCVCRSSIVDASLSRDFKNAMPASEIFARTNRSRHLMQPSY